jgi:hypothetical protein
MALAFVFLLGIINFAAHKAVLESGHPILVHLPEGLHVLGGRLSLIVEYVLLAGTMLMVVAGSQGWAWGYGIYSLANTGAAWMIRSGRF